MNGLSEIFLAVSIIANIILVAVIISQKSAATQLKKRLENPDIQLQTKILHAKISQLSQDPDALTELVRFSTLVKQGNKNLISNGPDVIEFFLEELERRWQLSPIGEIKSITRYNPAEHRCSEPVIRGELIEIEKPGWRLKGEIVKFATVKKTQGR